MKNISRYRVINCLQIDKARDVIYTFSPAMYHESMSLIGEKFRTNFANTRETIVFLFVYSKHTALCCYVITFTIPANIRNDSNCWYRSDTRLRHLTHTLSKDAIASWYRSDTRLRHLMSVRNENMICMQAYL